MPNVSTQSGTSTDLVTLLRDVRLRYQRVQQVAERAVMPGYAHHLHRDMSGLAASVIEAKAVELRRSALRVRDQGRRQRARLRWAEAKALGVPLRQVDRWVPDPDEHDDPAASTAAPNLSKDKNPSA